METLADDLILGAPAIAKETGFKVRQVYNLAEKGLIPVFKVGASLAARRSQLNQALSATAEG